jgi:hypothetical protein
MDQEIKRKCKHCLLKDIAPEEYLEHMQIYLSGLNEELKADDTIKQLEDKWCK